MSLTQLNKEQLESIPEASTSVKWIVEMATNAEATTWTDETRYINPKQLKNWSWYTITAGDEVLSASNSSINIPSTSYTKLKEIQVTKNWTYRISFTLTEDASWIAYWQIYKNWVSYWVENSTSWTNTFTEDLSFSTNDYIQVYCKVSSSWSVSNFKIKWTIIPDSLTFNVIS